jgi:hypothetical protein
MKRFSPFKMKTLEASPNIEIAAREVVFLPGKYRRPRGMLGGYTIEMYDDGNMSIRYEGIAGCFLVEVTAESEIRCFRYMSCEEICEWWWEEMRRPDLPECFKVDLDYCVRETREDAKVAPIIASF